VIRDVEVSKHVYF